MFRATIFFLAGVISYLVTGWLATAPAWFRSLDVPNARSSHTKITPRMGGLGIVALSEKAMARIDEARSPRAYFDLRPMRDQNARGYFPSTPAMSLLFGLDESLTMLLEEGMPNVAARHHRLANGVRAAVAVWGLRQCARQPEIASDTVTAIVVPEGVDSARIIDIAFKRYDISLGAGLAELAGKVFRIGHLGDMNPLTLAGALAGVEMALLDADVPVRLGAGVGAALAQWRISA